MMFRDDPRPRLTIRQLDRTDVFVAGWTLFALTVGQLIREGELPGLLGFGLALVAATAMLLRRVMPGRTLVVVAVVAAVWLDTGHDGFCISTVLLVALITVGNRCRPAVTLILTGGVALGVYIASAGADGGAIWEVDNLQNIGWFVSATTAGLVLRSRRVELAALDEHAAERREAEASSRVTEERLRIAQELHDTVGHTVATVTMQAEMAAHVIDSQPHEAAKALTAIAEVSRSTLQEIRTTLGLLRSTDDEATPPERCPTATLADVDGLFDVLRARGVRVETNRKGDDVTGLPSAVSSTLYRITQEAVTNIAKHGLDVTTAELRIEVGPHAVVLVVRDDGRPVETSATAPQGHHGLEGMRERAQAMGGTVSAQYRPGMGFEVLAVIPTDRPDISADRSDEMVS